MSETETPVDTSTTPEAPKTETPKAKSSKPATKAAPKKKAPEPKITLPPPLSKEEAEPGTPEYRHRVKVAKEMAKAKANNTIKSEWYEFTPNKNSKKGGKVLLCRRMANGNVHRVLYGFEKKLPAGTLEQFKGQGKLKIA